MNICQFYLPDEWALHGYEIKRLTLFFPYVDHCWSFWRSYSRLSSEYSQKSCLNMTDKLQFEYRKSKTWITKWKHVWESKVFFMIKSLLKFEASIKINLFNLKFISNLNLSQKQIQLLYQFILKLFIFFNRFIKYVMSFGFSVCIFKGVKKTIDAVIKQIISIFK